MWLAWDLRGVKQKARHSTVPNGLSSGATTTIIFLILIPSFTSFLVQALFHLLTQSKRSCMNTSPAHALCLLLFLSLTHTHTCIYMYTLYTCIHTYIYIYINMYIYTYICTYLHIYIYIERERETDVEVGRRAGGKGRKQGKGGKHTTRTALCNSFHPCACMHIKTLTHTHLTLHQTHRLTHASIYLSLFLTHTHHAHLIAAGRSLVGSRVAVSFALLSRSGQTYNSTTVTSTSPMLDMQHTVSLCG